MLVFPCVAHAFSFVVPWQNRFAEFAPTNVHHSVSDCSHSQPGYDQVLAEMAFSPFCGLPPGLGS